MDDKEWLEAIKIRRADPMRVMAPLGEGDIDRLIARAESLERELAQKQDLLQHWHKEALYCGDRLNEVKTELAAREKELEEAREIFSYAKDLIETSRQERERLEARLAKLDRHCTGCGPITHANQLDGLDANYHCSTCYGNQEAALAAANRRIEELEGVLRQAKEWAAILANNERVCEWIHQHDYSLYVLIADCPVDFDGALAAQQALAQGEKDG